MFVRFVGPSTVVPGFMFVKGVVPILWYLVSFLHRRVAAHICLTAAPGAHVVVAVQASCRKWRVHAVLPTLAAEYQASVVMVIVVFVGV